MSETVAVPVEQILREELSRGDAVIGTTVPILRHLLANDDHTLFSDEIVARVRGVISDISRQLLFALAEAAGEEERWSFAAPHQQALIARLMKQPALLAHVHSLAVEYQLSTKLAQRGGLDPVLTPFTQELIASKDAKRAANAMQVLAAQSRFLQHLRRMELPLGELPGEMFGAALEDFRASVGKEHTSHVDDAEEVLRETYDESRSRLALMTQLLSGLGKGIRDALSFSHSGIALFCSALALASGQERSLAVFSLNERQLARLSLGLRTAGLKPAAVQEQLAYLHPDSILPEGFDGIPADRAAALLADATPALEAEMASGPPYMAEALSDGEDRLIEASEPLAGLQLRCGGDLPGTIAAPALLELVRKSRAYGLRLARAIEVQDADEQVSAFIEVYPDPDGEGCRIGLAHWHSVPLQPEDLAVAGERRAEIDRQLAELSGRLDADQRLLSVSARTAELEPLAEAMEAGIGEKWTGFVELVGDHAGRSHHWRLLDGAPVRVEDSPRDWRVRLVPLGSGESGSQGFELHLVSEQPAPIVRQAKSAARKDEFEAANLGREIAPVLRQPISRIIANAETIRTQLAGPLADEYSNYAADIASAGEHLLSLLDDLADLEVVEDEEFATAPDKIDLADVARRAGGILGMRAQEKGLELALPGEKASLAAIAEFRRVLQILLNLIGNAIRYTPAGTEVKVELRRRGEWAYLTVADNGDGIPAEQQARMFKKFERLGRTGQGGTGLGLYISRQLARAMGGELTVESEEGEGARFILTLPRDMEG